MKQQRVNTFHMDKFKATHDKIGRKPETKDDRQAIIYTILMEYYTAMKLDIQDEPEYLPRKGCNDLIRNPNYEALDLIKHDIDRLDYDMRLSYYPKAVR